MTLKWTKHLLLLFSLLFLLPVRNVHADTGPKPTMEFSFKQELPAGEATITSGILYECQQSDCSDATPLREVGPQGFTCEANSCHALAYGFAPYHRLEIVFSDGKTRQSNIFQTAGFDSIYQVTVRPDDLLVEAQFSLGVFPRTFTFLIVACLCVLIAIAVIGAVIIFLVRNSKKS